MQVRCLGIPRALVPRSSICWLFGGLVAALAQTAALHAQSDYATPYTFTTLAGSPGVQGSADGTGSAAQFYAPSGIAVDSAGNVFVADYGNDTIRKITSGGVVTTLAGRPGVPGSTDGTGSAALFNGPIGIAVDGADNLYITDYQDDTIRKVSSNGAVTTLAGTAGVEGSADGTGGGAQFDTPFGIAVDNEGNVYVTDAFSFTIRKVTSTGVVTTLAGTAGVEGSADGTGSAAQFGYCGAVAVDSTGNVYVADATYSTIRKITSGGVVTTLAGSPGMTGSADGTGSAALFNEPYGIAVDSAGTFYVSDNRNSTIRKITSGGVVTTLAGSPGITGSADGTGSAALFYYPTGVAVDTAGNVYVTDGSNDTIRWGAVAPPVFTGATSASGAYGQGFTYTATFSSALAGPYGASGLPPGLSIDSATGIISGTIIGNTGTYTITLSAVNGAGTGSGSLSLVVSLGTRLINISTRAQVGTGGNILIPGFVIGGSGTETLLIRGDGPSLTQFGVAGVLTQPILTVLSGQKIVASNTGWSTNGNPTQIASVAAQVGAFPFAPGSADCALIVTLPPGGYTVEISGVGSSTGVALAEVYEVASSGTRLINLSTRALVGTSGNIVVTGFVIAGNGTEPLLVRADGPSLTQFGVAGVLTQPILTVLSGQTVIVSNTGWGTNGNPTQIASVAAQVGAFPFASGSADSAVAVNLAAGAYTAEVSGVNSTTGVALAEVYEVP